MLKIFLVEDEFIVREGIKKKIDWEAKGYEFEQAELSYVPKTLTDVTNEDDVKNLEKLIDMLEDNDDVQNVYHTWNMPEENEED